jgi:epoxyqueuosine reductase
MTVATLTGDDVKAKARQLGADLVGIASGAALDRNPPDPERPQTPTAVTPEDSRSVIVLARRLLHGLGRLKGHDDRHKQYSTELIIAELEEIELKLVYFLEEHGHAALTVPPVHTDPRLYDRGGDTRGPLSLPHAAVEAGLGTLGLNLMLLTPEYGPRVLLGAVLTSAELEPDEPLREPLCLGESCGRCLLACPGDAIRQWQLLKPRCAPYASPYGFDYLMKHVERLVTAPAGGAGGAAQVAGDLHGLAVDPARRRRLQRVHALRRRLSGRRRLRAAPARHPGRHSGADPGEGGDAGRHGRARCRR